LSGDPTFADLLAQVREVALGAYAHQDVPFEKLVEELHPERRASHSPLFQVMFVLQNIPTQAVELSGLTLLPVETHHDLAKFDLTLSMKETADGLAGHLEYNTDLFEPKTISRMIGHLEILLQGIVENPQERVNALPMWTETIELAADELDDLFA
jgi:non-ribosomal peptide synthetase component F